MMRSTRLRLYPIEEFREPAHLARAREGHSAGNVSGQSGTPDESRHWRDADRGGDGVMAIRPGSVWSIEPLFRIIRSGGAGRRGLAPPDYDGSTAAAMAITIEDDNQLKTVFVAVGVSRQAAGNREPYQKYHQYQHDPGGTCRKEAR